MSNFENKCEIGNKTAFLYKSYPSLIGQKLFVFISQFLTIIDICDMIYI